MHLSPQIQQILFLLLIFAFCAVCMANAACLYQQGWRQTDYDLKFIDALQSMNQTDNIFIYLLTFIYCLIFISFLIDFILYSFEKLRNKQFNYYNQIFLSFFIQSYNYLIFIPGVYLIMCQIQQNIAFILPFAMNIIISVTSIVHDQRYEFEVKDYLGRRSSFQYGLLQCLLEVLSCIYLGIFKNAIGQSIINSLLALTSLYTLVKSKPFQHQSIRKMSYFYAIYYALVTITLMFTLFNGNGFGFSLVAILMLPISYKLTNLLEKFQTSFGKICKLIKESDVQSFDFELRNLIQNVKLEYEDYRLSNLSLIMDQIAIQHKFKCQESQCFCQQTDTSKKDYQTTVISGSQRSFFLNDFIINSYQHQLRQIELKKQSLDTCLCLSYLNYLLFSNKSKVLAYTELVRYRNNPQLSLREQSLISELFQIANQQKQNKQNDKNFMAAIKYDEQIEYAEKHFQTILKMKEELLILLFNDYIELKDLRDKAIKLKQSRDQLQIQLVELSKIYYSSSSLQYLLDCYINLLGFGQNKKALFRRKKQSLFSEKNSKRFSIDQSLFDKDCCIVFITLVNRIGTIKRYQSKFTQIFGFTNKEVQDKNISIIIPPPIARHHDFILQQYVKGIDSGKDNDDLSQLEQEIAIQLIEQQKKGGSISSQMIKDIISNRKDNTSRYFPMLLGLNAKGWAFPISITFKFDSINQDDCGLTGLIQKLHSDYFYMQVDSDSFQIQAITEQLYNKAFDNIFIQNDIKKIYFNRFAPFIKHCSMMSKKKNQNHLTIPDSQKQADILQIVSDQKTNLNASNLDNSDTFKTMIFIPKGNVSDKNAFFLHDKPINNDQQLKQQAQNYSLEYYDIYITKFKFYHFENQLFKYSIIEFHNFRKINDFQEQRDSLFKIQKKFKDILQINYDITENLSLIDQMQNIQLISQANINSFLDIIEQEINQKSDENLIQSDIQHQIATDREEENIEATDRNHNQKDYRSNLSHLDPKSNMVSHQKQYENLSQIDLGDDQEPKSNQNDMLKIASTIVNIDMQNQSSFIDNDVLINKQIPTHQQFLNPPNQNFSSKKNQPSQKNQREQKKLVIQNDLKSLDQSYNILSPNDQSISYDFDNSRIQINQQVGLISLTDRVGIDDLTNNQNNYSITYTRQNYNDTTQITNPKQKLAEQHRNKQNQVDFSQQDYSGNTSSFSNRKLPTQFQINNNQQKLLMNDQDLEKTGIYSSLHHNGVGSILSPNIINTSKLSLNSTTNRNLLTSKPQLNNIVLQRLNEEIQKETDRGRLVKMESLRSTLKNHNLEDLALWKLSSMKKENSPINPHGGGGIDRKSKLETSYIIRAEADSSADCTDTVDREERIKRELQERSRMVAVSSRQSSQSNNTDMKRNLKKSLNSKKKSLLMSLLTAFGMLALMSILTLTLYQYFKTNQSFYTIQKDFYYIPWPVDLRSDYTIPLLYSGITKLIKTNQFTSIVDPVFQESLRGKMMTSQKHLFNIFNYYQTADINDREYFTFINNNPIDVTLGRDDSVVAKEKQTQYYLEDKVIFKMNLDYSILILAAHQYKVVIQDGNLNYYEKVQIDNYKMLEEQSILVSEVAMDCATSSNDEAVTQTLILLVLVITVSFILISAIFPLYYYVQSSNQSCLKLFATISSDQLATMLRPIQFTLSVSKSSKITTQNFNLNYQIKYKKRKNISSTSLLPKFRPVLLLCGFIAFVTLIIQPIVNYVLLEEFKKEVGMNIQLLSNLYSIRSLIISASALNYQYISYRTDENTFLYNPDFYASQIPLINQKFQANLNKMYEVIQNDQGLSRHNQSVYIDFLYKLLTENVCDAVKEFPEYMSKENPIDDALCRSVRTGLLTKGFELAVKDYYTHIQSLEYLYKITTRAEFQKAIQTWTELTKIKEFDQYFNLLTSVVVIIKDFMITMMNNYLDYMKFIQTVLLIFQIFALLFLFIFGWMNFYYTISKEMFLIKQLFSVLSIETVLENPYIISYLNR